AAGGAAACVPAAAGAVAAAAGAVAAAGGAITTGSGGLRVSSKTPTTTMPTTASTPTPRMANIHFGGPEGAAGMRIGAAIGENTGAAPRPGRSSFDDMPPDGDAGDAASVQAAMARMSMKPGPPAL